MLSTHTLWETIWHCFIRGAAFNYFKTVGLTQTPHLANTQDKAGMINRRIDNFFVTSPKRPELYSWPKLVKFAKIELGNSLGLQDTVYLFQIAFKGI
jgi:hypothetical protein